MILNLKILQPGNFDQGFHLMLALCYKFIETSINKLINVERLDCFFLALYTNVIIEISSIYEACLLLHFYFMNHASRDKFGKYKRIYINILHFTFTSVLNCSKIITLHYHPG